MSSAGRALLLVVAVAIAAHVWTLGNELVFDDKPAIRENPIVQGPLDLGRLLARDFWGRPPGPGGTGTWRPIPTLTFWLDQHAGGGRAWVFHLTSVLCHAFAAAALLWALLVHGCATRVSAAAAALFAVMTVNSEAVAAVVGRADVLAAGFSFLAWGLLGPPAAPARPACLGLSAGALLAALLCKETAVAFVVLVILAERLLVTPRSRFSWPRHAALLLPVALAFAARTAWFALPGEALARSWNNNPLLGEPVWVRLLTAFRLTLLALRNALVPLNLSPDYSYAEILPDRTPFSPDVLAGAATAALLAAAVIALRRRRPAVALGALLFSVPWAAVSNVAVPLPTIFAERLLYAPAAGIALAVAAALDAAAERGWRRAALGAFLVLFLANGALTALRDRAWRDDLTLFEAARLTSPRSVRVLTNLGAALVERGRHAEALPPLESALALAPDFAAAHTFYGAALDELGEAERAHAHLTRAAALDPLEPQAHHNLAVFYARRGHKAEALAVLRAFLARRPESPRERALLLRIESGP